jgi:hypothetical protein
MSSYITDIDILTVTSSVSIPFYQITLPATETISGEFIYNYYTRDESIAEETSLDAVDDESDAYDFISENWEEGTYPRQINLSFGSEDAYLTKLLDPGVLLNAITEGKITFEDAPFDSKFSGILVHDTSVDEKIYNIISGSGRSTRRSRLSEDFLNVAKLQSEGYRFSRGNTREQVRNLYQSDIKSVNLPISLNDLFINDVLKTSLTWQASAFADEFFSTLPISKEVQDEERAATIPTIFSISEKEMDIELKSYSTILVASGVPKEVPPEEIKKNIRKVGYVIEKYGEQFDGSVLRYPDIVIDDPNGASYEDRLVRYGGVYNYKVRTVYETSITTPLLSGTKFAIGGYTINKILIASTGTFTTIKCEEKIPPLPPNNLSFQQTLNGLYIRWNFPINKQKDIKRFQIFRRPDISRPFSLIKEINFDLSILPYTSGERVPNERIIRAKGPVKHYLDADFNDIDSDYIYAVCAIDAHGYSSAYSEQFRVRFDKLTGKLLITRVSTEGAPKPYPNVNVLGDFFSDLIKDSGHSRVRIYFDPEYRDVKRDGKSLNLISTDTTSESSYRFSMTEINLGQSQTVNISIKQPPVTQNGIPVSIARFYKAS